MKISVKLLLITFAVVVLISGLSTVIYYSLSNSLLETQFSKTVLNSTSDFVNIIHPMMNDIDEEGAKIALEKEKPAPGLKGYTLDFIFKIVNDSLIDFSAFRGKDSLYLNRSTRSIKTFVKQNSSLIFRASQGKDNTTFFFGKAVTEKMLNQIAEKIRAEIAFVVNGNVLEVSHSFKNRNYLHAVSAAVIQLKYKSNYDLHREYLEESDFMASIFTPKLLSVSDEKISFIIFNNNSESLQFRSTIKLVMIIIIISGIALSLVLIMLFTTRIRKQIYLLNEGAEITAKGDLDHRVDVITGDEIGRFGITFNKMLNELGLIKNAEKEFLEFITMLNQNPSIKEIAEAALTKIIKGTGLTFGVVYLVDEKELINIASHGVSTEFVQPVQSANFYSKIIEEKEVVEFVFNENFPEIRTGLAYIKLKYLLICPVIYNKEVIAIIELASESAPRSDVRKYFDTIHDQLAIGMINAKSLSQLENYIEELKTLNLEYQKQNLQIKGQNEKLIELHTQLQEKANELEEKRNQAVQLTLVKSQFLANMSHELKTPLISIIGLTDLTIKEFGGDAKIKERLGVVLRNGKKLLNMINNILEFSKFESGNVEVKREVFLLSELINEIKDNIQPLAREKGLFFTVNYSGEAFISTDKTLLERILLNLLFNAVKFTDKGSIELSISLSAKGDAEFKVTDTGIGISEANQKFIFEEFKQVEEGSTKTYSGAGLGLAISRRYIEMLGGKITLKSRLNSGTTFKVFLPKILVELIHNRQPDEFNSEAFTAGDRGVNAILLGNRESTVKLLQDYLINYHINLMHITSIKELQKINPANVDVLFVDINEEYAGAWNLIGKIKKGNSNILTLVIRMVEERKIGFGLDLDEIVTYPSEDTPDKLAGLIKKPGNICIIGRSILEVNAAGDENNKVFYHSYSDREKLDAFLKVNKISSAIITMLEPDFNSIDLIYHLRKDKAFRNIYVVFALPENINEKNARQLINEMDDIAQSAKYHPMDVLKVIRDRMTLRARAENLETEEDTAPTGIIIEEETAPERTVLIVDDDNDTLFTIGEIVSGAGFGVLYARNGIECLGVLEKQKPELILLDIMMPQMDGFETVRRIRGNKETAGIPVAALTAYEMLDNREVVEKNGFNDLITKPIDSKTLVFKIEKLLLKKNEENISN